ncbi:UNKNOWN [Stylonychia lemnae]|uniref:Uncharacterized protein n=1 Tax=Stylonychia lemnae TaxID=5949 RepID=A0A077ZQR6_STYLE|nr:UNKNOWN [Stylonychia lemnae]|eukprot:CDW72268.1 UNKNOWN [Stylonychia lemnae]
MNTQNNLIAINTQQPQPLQISNNMQPLQSLLPLSAAQSPNQTKVLSPTTMQFPGSHGKTCSMGSDDLYKLSQIQRQKYILQQSQLYARAGNKFKAQGNGASQPSAQKPKQNGTVNQFDNIGWVFLKNDQLNPSGGTAASHNSQNSSFKKRIQNRKELNQSGVLSDNTSVDSQNNDRSFVGGQNLAEIIQKHQQIREEQSASVDMKQLQDHQVQYNIQDLDSPQLILDKIQTQVHDQMCNGGQNNYLNFQALNFQKLNQSTKHSARVSMNNINTENQINDIGGNGSNFQSFKKNAMKLPKVTLRHSLINQYTSQKTSSQPISPRIFDNAKFGGSGNPKKSQNSSGFGGADNTNINNSQNQINPFSLPLIDKNTQQSTQFIDNTDSTALINQNNSAGNVDYQQIYNCQNNRSLNLRDNQKFGEMESLLESQAEIKHNSQSNTGIDQTSGSFLTETKIELKSTNKFNLKNLKLKALQSPQQHHQFFVQSQERQSSMSSYKNSFITEQQMQPDASAVTFQRPHDQPKSKISSGTQFPADQGVFTSVQKICSSCNKKTSGKQQFSFDSQQIESIQRVKRKNYSCLSDGMLEEESFEFEEPPLNLRQPQQRLNLNLPRLNNSVIEHSDISISNSIKPNISPSYNVIRDNPFFTNFAKNYNQKLIRAFEEADKANSNEAAGNCASLKQDVLAYMEQNNEIRQLIKEEALKNATLVSTKGKIKKVLINKKQLQKIMNDHQNNNSQNNNNSSNNNNSTNENISGTVALLNDSNEDGSRNGKNSSDVKAGKQEIMKNYGRWYLKPNDFNKIMSNLK